MYGGSAIILRVSSMDLITIWINKSTNAAKLKIHLTMRQLQQSFKETSLNIDITKINLLCSLFLVIILKNDIDVDNKALN